LKRFDVCGFVIPASKSGRPQKLSD
jgi:hypothetical protein